MAYLLRLVACLFLCVSLNSYGATLSVFVHNGNALYEYDTTTETTNLLASPNNITFGSDGGGSLAAVALPACIYLFLSGLVGLGLIRGRNA